MKNVKLIVQYDGSNYFGWQKQNGYKTVEGEILKAIKKLTGKDVILSTAGRTDKGVHAFGQVTNFFIDDKFTTDNIRRGLNTFLGEESIQITKVEEVEDCFHSRFSAKGKLYRYVLSNNRLMHPMYRNYKGYTPYKLDLNRIRYGSKILLGHHNFSSFTNAKIDEEINMNRTLDKIEVKEEKGDIIFYFEAESFLRNMVRIIVGSLIEVGRGKRDIDWLEKALLNCNRINAGPTISPNGLYLMKVYY
ncbi:tRNA pseudouridine(38-40) synthase TruA [Miniphocaeibacter halophilus]|uniref:tRNA pseudouridine(38-40) synthase TruA n=1 Tax=Miniphocaeibacter halophilus TaxID=2931922 RepID=A0AC61MP55_9FIRM|nr:tRNA pseudouridine(38-40) synthase TruA [Miniphocaeibacter halophilus]QQK07187.1 tRNA pseudouridine(38-40) synthase TruA [Miniphocaeibacter halophilus]